jgi:hypothetical protein
VLENTFPPWTLFRYKNCVKLVILLGTEKRERWEVEQLNRTWPESIVRGSNPRARFSSCHFCGLFVHEPQEPVGLWISCVGRYTLESFAPFTATPPPLCARVSISECNKELSTFVYQAYTSSIGIDLLATKPRARSVKVLAQFLWHHDLLNYAIMFNCSWGSLYGIEVAFCRNKGWHPVIFFFRMPL